MPFDYVTQIGELSQSQRVEFYEMFAYDLTISVRGVWNDSSLNDAEKVERMKWLNELMHRVTAKIQVTRLNSHEWTEADMWDTIRNYAKVCPGIGPLIVMAIKSSYEKCGIEM